MKRNVLLVALSLTARAAMAQGGAPIRLSLTEAMARADSASETVGIARTDVRRAEADRVRARAAFLPTLSGAATYTRTLKSQFSGFATGDSDPVDSNTAPDPINCTRFIPDPTLTVDQRLAALERGLDCSANGDGGIDFSSLPFGRPNTYNFALSGSQTLFNASARGSLNSATATRDAAEQTLTSQQAGARFDVAQAYLDAQLAVRLAEIADSTLAQAGRTWDRTRTEREVGNVSDFDLLRATVARDNQRPVVAQRRAARDLALLRLRQLLGLPATQSLELTTALGDTAAIALNAPAVSDTAVAARVPVRAAEAAVRSSDGLLSAARGQRIPSLTISSTYAKIAFPEKVFGLDDFVTDWSVVARVDVPIFNGGRRRADIETAAALRDASALRLQQARKQAEREVEDTRTQLEAARTTWEVSGGTADAAQRAYEIAEVRYREGLSTLTELNDVRLQLDQAQVNRAQAARDLLLARVRQGMLRELPFGAGTGIATPAIGVQFNVPSSSNATPVNPITTNSTTGNPVSGTTAGGGFPE